MKYLGISRTCPQNVPVLTILGHLKKCPESIHPMSFLNFSNLSYVLSQTFPKMCPRTDMYQTRREHVLDVSSKCPCPDHLGTSPNRKSETKVLILNLKLRGRIQSYSNSFKKIIFAASIFFCISYILFSK